jgi:hypothetical protein
MAFALPERLSFLKSGCFPSNEKFVHLACLICAIAIVGRFGVKEIQDENDGEKNGLEKNVNGSFMSGFQLTYSRQNNALH